MSAGRDVAEALDGPLGWVVVALVVAAVAYVVIEKTAAQAGQASAQIDGDIQGFKCWFSNSCVLADLWHGATS